MRDYGRSTTLSPMTTRQEIEHRIATALSEAGYPGARVFQDLDPVTGYMTITYDCSTGLPGDIVWRCGFIALKGNVSCWSCWTPVSGDEERDWACGHGICESERLGEPLRPPHHLVRFEND